MFVPSFIILAVLLNVIIVVSGINEEDIFPFQNISLPWKERVNDLVDRLTLHEMIEQMAWGGGDAGPSPAIPRLGISPYNVNTECLHGVVAPNQATAFPQSIGLSATFR